ncbi:UNVERIFIED_CONTAM: 30S ribosomal protein S21, chloroplastic [Sesamum latifolium]|uniref:30S ribosomal protein S21, chloroplastic n=1 Tax=Sesamum latifolium TaxID=2727402 RepID=A0AAW2Y7Z5_9LAMI
MAATAPASSIPNLFSFFTSTKPPPPSQLFLYKTQSKLLTLSSCTKDRWAPLISSNEIQTSPSEIMSVVCPSLAYANTLFFRSAYNVQVIVDDNEPEEKLLGRFRREVMRAGVIQECKRRRFFENKHEEKKRKSREAAKRNRRRRPQSQMGGPQEASSDYKKKGEEDEDNWDLPQGELPY